MGTLGPMTPGGGWKPLRIGGGGWVTGIDIVGSTMVCRCDAFGAYVWDSGVDEWKCLCAEDRLTAAPDMNFGCYEIKIAPSDASVIYMSWNNLIYKSTNGGASFSATGYASAEYDWNGQYRTIGQKMAVDPVNADVVYAGVEGLSWSGSADKGKLRVTTNGGTSWAVESNVPTATGAENPGPTGIAFDPTSGTTDGRQNTCYVCSWGNGVYRTTNAGGAWSLLAGGPTDVVSGCVGPDGAYYCCAAGGVYKYAAGWSTITPAGGLYRVCVAADPLTSERIVVTDDGGSLAQSLNGGSTWSTLSRSNITRESSADIPWLEWTQEAYMSNGGGGLLFDPATGNKLWFAQGIGVWTATLPTAMPASLVWTSQTLGIEELVVKDVIHPPGGIVLTTAADRAIFTHDDLDAFPSLHEPQSQTADHSLVMGHSLDYAQDTPAFIVAYCSVGAHRTAAGSGYSQDGGLSWTEFAALPPFADDVGGGGSIAVADTNTFVWSPGNGGNFKCYYTKNRGATWTVLTLPSPFVDDYSEDGWQGFGWAAFVNRHIVCADRVNTGTFYIFHYIHGLFRSTDNGDTWTLRGTGCLQNGSAYNATLKAVPGHAGHLFFTMGQQSSGPTGDFRRSTDGGANWTNVANVLEVYAFGFGKEKPGESYPAIYIAGWVSNVWGIWRSDDDCATWTKIGEYPLSVDRIYCIDGDKDVYGRMYFGTMGNGAAYYQP